MKKPEHGFILLSILLSTTVLTLMGIAALQLVSSNLRAAKAEQSRVNAQLAADAGLDDAISKLNANNNWSGSGSAQTLYSSDRFRTTYQTSVADGSEPTQKFISVEAHTYVPASSSTPTHTRKYVVEVRGVTAGDYSVVTGVGGLELANSSKILGGSVYVNGRITMSNTAQIGTTTNSVNVRAAHASCPVPPNATYPRVCAGGENGQPITINNSARIYGEVQATNQTNGSGMVNPGLVTGSPAPINLPTYDRAAQMNAVTTTHSGGLNCWQQNMTWPANYRINGNVTIGKCNITVTGNVWITGNFNMSNQSKLIVANSLGTTKPVIMIDGKNISPWQSEFTSNSSGTGFRVIAYWSTRPCSYSTNVATLCNVTGADLYNSSSEQTIALGQTAGPNSEFFAPYTKIDLNNTGNIGAVAGQTIKMSNSSTITFGTTVAGGGNIEGWVVTSYKRTF